jgi:Raf kinase inhibitor-like YbhB/YbcL family protein
MKTTLSVATALILFCNPLLAQVPAATPQGGPPRLPNLVLTSTAFKDGGVLPDKYSGLNPIPTSPPLSWTNIPAGTASIALLMHDPDTAPAKSTTDILHWLAFNIPASATSLPEGVAKVAKLPDGTIQIKNRDSFGFAGPGAPPGAYHHYTIELYALDTKLSLDANATREDVIKAMDGHVLSRGEIVALFHRT